MIPSFVYNIVVAYVVILVFMFVFQRHMLYHPTKHISPPVKYGLPEAEDIMITGEDGMVLQIWYQEAKNGLPTILYFHGNAGNIADRAGIFAAFAEKGLGVAMLNYRGYGASEGSPNEQGIYQDARTAIKWLKSRAIPLSNMAFYGESLGTGVAIKMAKEFPPKAIFLQAPYLSVAGRAAEIYWFVPVNLLIRDRFDSLTHIKDVKTPLTIFHGRKDNVIPLRHGETLFAAANQPKQIIVFDETGHNDFDSRIIAQHVLERVTH